MVGSSYGCSDPSAWFSTSLKSRTGFSIFKNTLQYDFLLNTDGKMEKLNFRSKKYADYTRTECISDYDPIKAELPHPVYACVFRTR